MKSSVQAEEGIEKLFFSKIFCWEFCSILEEGIFFFERVKIFQNLL